MPLSHHIKHLLFAYFILFLALISGNVEIEIIIISFLMCTACSLIVYRLYPPKDKPEPTSPEPEKVKVKPVKVNRAKTAPASSPQSAPQPKLVPAPQTSTPATTEPQKQDNFKSFCIIAAFFALFFFVVYTAIYNQNDTQPEEYYIVTSSGTGYTREEVIDLVGDFTILYNAGENIVHWKADCVLLDYEHNNVYKTQFKYRNQVIPKLTKDCAFCFDIDRISDYLRLVEIKNNN